MDDPKVQRVVDAGADLGIDVMPSTFPEGTATAVDAAAAIGCDVDQIVKSLVFASDRGPLLFLVSGANRLDLSLAAKAAEVDEVRKADANEVKRATGFSIGATPPFGHATDLPTFIDEHLLTFDEVWAAAGRSDSVFPIAPTALRDLTGARVEPLAEKR